jgi:hypothetical protein
MINIKGSVLLARLAFVQSRAGTEGVDRVLNRLPAESRGVVRSALFAAWYPFELGRQLDEAVRQELGGGRADFFMKLGEASADSNLKGVHKGFLKSDPHAFLAQSPTIYAFYYDQGRRTYEAVGPNEAVLTTYDAILVSEAECQTNLGWHRRALELCGARNVVAVEDECRARGGAVCRYRLSWK